MSYADFALSRGYSGYASQPVAPVQSHPPVPPPDGSQSLYLPPPNLGNDSYGSAQPLPYDPNVAPLSPPNPAPSTNTTPMNPHKGKSLNEIPPSRG